jgi:hypothetical protein
MILGLPLLGLKSISSLTISVDNYDNLTVVGNLASVEIEDFLE